MMILHLSNTPLSNAPENLANCQRQAGHQASLLLSRKSNLNKVHVGGTIWSELKVSGHEGSNLDLLKMCFDKADVIHMHNFAWEQKVFQTHPELIEIAKTKKCLIQYHSPRYSIESFEATINDPFFKGKRAVIAQYHPRLYPECEHIVPNVIPIYDQAYMPIVGDGKWSDAVPTVSYAPSNITGKDWDDKGHRFVSPVLQELERRGMITKDIMIGVPYDECMNRKRWSHLGIDEFVTGSYHMSSLEYFSMGVMVVGFIDDLTRNAIDKVAGHDAVLAFPNWQVMQPERFEHNIRSLLTGAGHASSMKWLQHFGQKAREWMEQYWNPANHVKLFDKIYEGL